MRAQAIRARAFLRLLHRAHAPKPIRRRAESVTVVVEQGVLRREPSLSVVKLRDQKSEMPEPEYYKLLEPMLLDLARLYQSAK